MNDYETAAFHCLPELSCELRELRGFNAPRIARAAGLDERTSRPAFRRRLSEEGSGLPSAILAGGASNQTRRAQLETLLRASGIAHRRTEKERAEAFFPPRATTTAADPTRPGSRAPLAWTNERADTLFRLRVSEEGSGLPSAILASGASNQPRVSSPKHCCHILPATVTQV
jgi:hypothetical protein